MSRVEPHIAFNRPHVTGAEFGYMGEAIRRGHLAGKGIFSQRCCDWLQREVGSYLALLTHSCTGALEMAFTLAEIGPGDEVVMPSFTFVSTASAVVARGGTPVFVDIREDTLCIDERLVEGALTEQTKAITAVHYAGVASDMKALTEIGARHGLLIIEDAAQGIRASMEGRPLGSIGDLATLSFHETKNVSCGEGGALLVNNPMYVERAQIVHDKGTDRTRFFRGLVDKYTWVDVGSSYALSDLAAAYLWAQLESVDAITERRVSIWNRYHESLEELEVGGHLQRPVVPDNCRHNGHTYYVLVDGLETRTALIGALARVGINAVFHYVPLHNSAAGKRFGRSADRLPITESVSERLVRLPLWPDMTEEQVVRVIDALRSFFRSGHAV